MGVSVGDSERWMCVSGCVSSMILPLSAVAVVSMSVNAWRYTMVCLSWFLLLAVRTRWWIRADYTSLTQFNNNDNWVCEQE